MKAALLGALTAGLCSTAMANVIEFNGVTYETIDWTNVSTLTNTAQGTVGGVGVSFEAVQFSTESVTNNNFGIDAGFDALLFGEGQSESVKIFGGIQGVSSLTFDQQVGSVLMLIGSPNDGSTRTQFGAAIWDFDDGFQMSLIDHEVNPGLELGDGNVVTNVITGPTTHQSGVIGIEGDLSELSWTQDTSNGVDEMLITFAVAPATVPAPGAFALLGLGGLVAGRRRR